MSSNQFYPLTIKSIRRDTRDSMVLSLEPQPKHADIYKYKSGQYLILKNTINKQDVRRSYSICSAEHEKYIRVGIKKVDDGVFSSWIHENASIGESIYASHPQGNFHVDKKDGKTKNYLGIAAGSGITPVLGILKHVLQDQKDSRFTLIYGNRSSNSIMFREELEDVKNKYLGRFSIIHVLSRENSDIPLFHGRINEEKLSELFKLWIDINNIEKAFICGPYEMMLQASKSLLDHGLNKDVIKSELFVGVTTKQPKQAIKPTNKKDLREVTVIIDGRQRQFKLANNQISLLDAALKEGIDLPHACKGGVCSTCKAMLLEGEVDMDANFSLEDYEIDRGYILSCQSYPISKKIVVDFDR